METIVSRNLSVHLEHELLLKLEAAGLNDDLAQRVVGSKDNELAKQVVRLIQIGGFEPSTSQKRAREIMGQNFFGVEEAIKHYGVNPTPAQLATLAEIPWSEEHLQACKGTHVLAAIFPLSILEIRGRVANNKTKLFYNQDWYNNQAFAGARGEIRWQLVKKTPVTDSTGKTWDQQQTLLTQDEETPTAQVMVYTIIGHFLATGERLFRSIYVRCSDLGASGSRVDVGDFGDVGLDLDDYGGDGSVGGGLGLASGRKF